MKEIARRSSSATLRSAVAGLLIGSIGIVGCSSSSSSNFPGQTPGGGTGQTTPQVQATGTLQISLPASTSTPPSQSSHRKTTHQQLPFDAATISINVLLSNGTAAIAAPVVVPATQASVFIPNVPVGVVTVVVTALDANGNHVSSYTITATVVANQTVTVNSGPGLVSHSTSEYMYTTNTASQSISGFQMDPATGAVQALSGFPVDSPGAFTLTTDQTGDFLYVCDNINYAIRPYAVNRTTGAITAVNASGIGSMPFQSPDFAFPVISNDNNYLYVGQSSTGAQSGVVAGFQRDPNSGYLTPLAGSPFNGAGGYQAAGASVNGAVGEVTLDLANHLYIPTAETLGSSTLQFMTDFTINSDGSLTPLPDSPSPLPIIATPPSANVLQWGASILDPITSNLYVQSNLAPQGITIPNSLAALPLNSDGSLGTILPGSPIAVQGATNAGVVFSPSGDYFYVSDVEGQSLDQYQVNSDGSATFVASVATGPTPGHVSIDLTGGLVAVACRGTAPAYADSSISLYQLNASTGALTFLSTTTVGGRADQVVFVAQPNSAAGNALLPAGDSLTPQQLTLNSSQGQSQVNSDGSFSLPMYDSSPTLAFASGPDGRVALLGFLNGGTSGADISPTSTAVALLYYALGGFTLPAESQQQLMDELEQDPALPALVQAVQTSLTANPGSLSDGDPTLAAAVMTARQAVIAEAQAAASSSSSIVAQRAVKTPFGPTIVGVSNPLVPKSGVTMDEAGREIEVTNYWRKISALYVFHSSDTATSPNQTPGDTTVLNPAVLLKPQVPFNLTNQATLFVNSVSSLGSIVQTLVSIIAHSVPGSPASLPYAPQMTTIGPDILQLLGSDFGTGYTILMVSPSLSGKNFPPLTGDLAPFSALQTNFQQEYTLLNANALLQDFILPVFGTILGGVGTTKLDTDAQLLLTLSFAAENIFFSLSDFLVAPTPSTWVQIIQRSISACVQPKYALTAVALLGRALVFKQLNQAAASVILGKLAKCNLILTAIDAAITSGDIGSVTADLTDTRPLETWSALVSRTILPPTPPPPPMPIYGKKIPEQSGSDGAAL